MDAMPVTLLDHVRSVVGEKDQYSAEDHQAAAVPIVGGCQSCAATIASYNAYPSRTGYLRCAECIADRGFATVEEFAAWMSTA